MHIGIGEFEGKELKDPIGEILSPRTLTIKEEIFTIIGTRVLEANVLDVNDGNGVYGIESLSRGASFCRFVNNDKNESKTIKENLEIVGVTTDYVLDENLEEFLNPDNEYHEEKYDVIFFEMKGKEDQKFLTPVLEKQKTTGITIVTYPNINEFELPDHPDESKILERREFEDKKVDVFMKIVKENE